MSQSETARAESPAILVEILTALGSTPREAGAFMLVSDSGISGTIGGGQLEFMAIDHARRMLAGEAVSGTLDIPLGPEIGQCCGGRTVLGFRPVDAAVAAEVASRQQAERALRRDVWLFGAGHVGLALAAALRPLPFAVTVVETRRIDPADLPKGMPLRTVAMPEAEVAGIRPGGAAVILTHDHALDFLIGRAALERPDLPYVGMIGSATKRATFRSWLAREAAAPGLIDRLVLPIGGSAVRDKRPAVIAALVAAELIATLLTDSS
ncbi:xanthine dehydrogenase accessory protein XdhC [Rhizobium halophytocola]|uniref:Xanthine dehydrogenase accessory factor n=1 Tax=Rhizobium halophytocola TaxID=735519 RepID=A0ABS4DSC3_9HYPH|nr:xanthine dehydrogenase accessory protein XdhC [Rhizobium halophytocola]MBP1848585.1 xanthine dehydrogenase accessory factor [Rhizobium halophytocola]